MLNHKKWMCALLAALITQVSVGFAEPISDEAVVVADESVLTELATDTETVPAGDETVPVADNTPVTPENPTTVPQSNGLVSNEIIVDFYVSPVKNPNWSGAVFGIYDQNKLFLGAQKIDLAESGVTHTLTFTVPEYKTGEVFYLMPISGVFNVHYYDAYFGVGSYIELNTYAYLPTSLEDSGIGNRFSFSVTPLFDREVNLSINSFARPMKNRIKIQDDYCIVPLYELANHIGIDVSAIDYNETTGRIQINYNDKKAIFFVGLTDAFDNDTFTHAETKTSIINDVVYIPLRFVITAFGGTISGTLVDSVLEVQATIPVNNSATQFVNSQNIDSKTNYMIWVSKSDYTVTVFQGSKNNWTYVTSFPCSIGAPSTPTVTGEYDYFSRETRWSYPTYYVGPIMRFYRGYAIHSTLIGYDGSTVDGRLGMKISHGCVRVAPESINWLVDTIPLYTKIYVTN